MSQIPAARQGELNAVPSDRLRSAAEAVLVVADEPITAASLSESLGLDENATESSWNPWPRSTPGMRDRVVLAASYCAVSPEDGDSPQHRNSQTSSSASSLAAPRPVYHRRLWKPLPSSLIASP